MAAMVRAAVNVVNLPIVEQVGAWLLKYLHRGEQPPLYYWRTVAGSEVDVVTETQSGLIPMEIKLSETPRPEMAKEILAFQ